MPVQRVLAHPRVADDVGHVALERGPIVYCVEAADNGPDAGERSLPDGAKLHAEHREDLLGGVSVLRCTDPTLTAIPYYAWSHRGAGSMAVWLRRVE